MQVTIVGAGIMGLASAWALARAGHRVSVYEQGSIPNPLGSSVDEHRVIRHAYGESAGYAAMAESAFQAWELLWADLGQRLYQQTGVIAIDRGDGTFARASARQLTALAAAHRWLDAAELEAAYPLLDTAEVTGALYTEAGGFLHARAIVAALAAYLETRAVRVYPQSAVKRVDPQRARIELAAGGTQNADALVIAAGPWVSRLLPDLAERVTPSRQVVAYIEPPAVHAAAWEAMPVVIDVGARADHRHGCYIIPPRARFGLKAGDHSFSLRGDPDRERTPGAEETTALLARFGRSLRDPAGYRVREGKTCFYTVEAKERFIVEAVAAKTWVMTGFSGHGFKFGALLGLGLAAGVSGRCAPAALARWAAGQAPEGPPFDLEES
ncbi:MAG: FAD-dependent oxidoreductase [Gammaproteobacteria bacterium]